MQIYANTASFCRYRDNNWICFVFSAALQKSEKPEWKAGNGDCENRINIKIYAKSKRK